MRPLSVLACLHISTLQLYHKPCATVTDPNFHWQPLPLSPLILAMTAAELVFCVMFVFIVNILYGWNIYWKYTYTHLTALFPVLPWWAGTRKVKPIWIFLKQETVSGSGISWAVCKPAPRSRQITMPAPHHSGRLLYLKLNLTLQYAELRLVLLLVSNYLYAFPVYCNHYI